MKKALRIVLIIFLLLVAAYFSTRNFFAKKLAARLSEKIKDRYGFQLSYADIRMTGLAGIELDKLRISPPQAEGDTLVAIEKIYLRPSIPHLFAGRLKLSEVNIADMLLHITGHDSVANYKPVRKRAIEDSAPTTPETDYARLLHGLASKAFDFSPQKSMMRDVRIVIELDSIRENLVIPLYSTNGDSLHGTLVDEMNEMTWKMEGVFSQGDETFSLKIFPGENKPVGFPLVRDFTGGYCTFDTLEFTLAENSYRSGTMHESGYFHAHNILARHPRLSADTISIRNLQFDFHSLIGKNYVEIDSATVLVLNSLPLQLYARIEKEKDAVYALQLRSGKQPANHFFFSLPDGIFSEVQDVEADGSLDFSLRFRMNTADPDKLVFDVQMKKDKFRLNKLGRNNLAKMNGEFEHTVFEYGHPVKSFRVGPSYPGYVPFAEVSPYLKYAILTSEDGNFFYHNGFNEEAFRQSIIANFKAGRFVRGGSTISMQLIKNVYLSRTKTVARKVEEALLVWLIESNRLVPKERMFEVYLNIIELGPMIYGVKDASRFYFDKLPSELTLAESIFLASLLPHPKWFKYSFDSTGAFKPYFADYYRVVSNFMLKKNLITEAEYNSLEPKVELKGLAREMVVRADTIPADSTEDMEF